MISDPAVIREFHDGVTVLRLNRPTTRNALTDEIKTQLCDYIPQFFAAEAERCLVLTGSGEAFCAGGDLQTLRSGQTVAQTRARMAKSHLWARLLLTGEKPVVMAVNGAAAGAGFGLALLGDLTIAVERAYFLPGFFSVGVAADLALPLTLSRAVGVPRAKQILFCNKKLSAAEALQLGLIAELVSPARLFERAMELARQLATGPTLAIGLTKNLINASFDRSAELYFTAEVAAQAIAFASSDCKEGVEAFLGKRAPRFIGR